MSKLQVVAETQEFIANCREAGVSEEERRVIIDEVAKQPVVGDLVKGSVGMRERRFAPKGRGRSGGWRVMVAYLGLNALSI
jgi:hypothetical protein